MMARAFVGPKLRLKAWRLEMGARLGWDYTHFAFTSSPVPTWPGTRLDAVIHRVLDQGLKDEGRDAMGEGLGRCIDGKAQPVAEAQCVQVHVAARWLEARFGNSRMTGSGSAVFARAGTGSQPLANWAADELPPTWVGRMCRSLSRHPLVDWAG